MLSLLQASLPSALRAALCAFKIVPYDFVEPETILRFELLFCTIQKRKPPSRRMEVLFFGVPKGIRTPVTAVKGRCPRPLDDGDAGRSVEKLGGARRDRTADLLHAMQALSQLSYSPFEAGTLRTPAHAVKKPGSFHRFDGKSITWLGLSPRLTQEVLINTDVLVQAV